MPTESPNTDVLFNVYEVIVKLQVTLGCQVQHSAAFHRQTALDASTPAHPLCHPPALAAPTAAAAAPAPAHITPELYRLLKASKYCILPPSPRAEPPHGVPSNYLSCHTFYLPIFFPLPNLIVRSYTVFMCQHQLLPFCRHPQLDC